MITEEQIIDIISKAEEAREKETRPVEEIETEAINLLIYKEYLHAYHKAKGLNSNLVAELNQESTPEDIRQQFPLSKEAMAIFYIAMKETEKKSLLKTIDFNWQSYLISAGSLIALGLFAYFTPTAVAVLTAVIVGAIPFIIGVFIAIGLGINGFFVGMPIDDQNTFLGGLVVLPLLAGLYTYPLALIAMPVIAIIAESLAALTAIIAIIDFGIKLWQAPKTLTVNEDFKTSMREALTNQLTKEQTLRKEEHDSSNVSAPSIQVNSESDVHFPENTSNEIVCLPNRRNSFFSKEQAQLSETDILIHNDNASSLVAERADKEARLSTSCI